MQHSVTKEEVSPQCPQFAVHMVPYYGIEIAEKYEREVKALKVLLP